MARRGIGRLCTILLFVIIGGVALYQGLWSIQMEIDLMRARKNGNHFEKLWTSSMDEVAEWRKKYDVESSRAGEHLRSFTAITQQLQNKSDSAAALEHEKSRLEKENILLTNEITRLKYELDKRNQNERLAELKENENKT